MRQAAYRIIDGKGATNYGIGAGIASIVRAIRDNSRTVMTLSAPAPELEYVHGACLSLPRILGARGIETTLHPALSEEEHEAIDHTPNVTRGRQHDRIHRTKHRGGTRNPRGTLMKDNPVKALAALGQSIWLDYIRRNLIVSGELRRLIEEDGLRGMTSNPSIFEKAIGESHDYDEDIRAMALEGKGVMAIYEALSLGDVQSAADAFQPVY